MISGRRGAAVLGLLVLAVGCGTGSSGTAAAPSPSVTPSSSPSASAVPGLSPTTKPSARPTASATSTPAAGSKDFGYFPATASRTPPVVQFDRATLLTGEDAQKAAAAHGEEAFDYYVVNDNPKLRALTLASSVVVRGSIQLNGFAAKGEGSVDLKVQPLSVFFDFLATSAGKKTAWNLVYGPGGTVTRIDEQYFP